MRYGSAALISGGLAGVAGCLGNTGGQQTEGGNDLVQLHTLGSEGSIYVPVYLLAQENNIWENHGIDLSLEIAGFGKYTRAFTENLSDVTSFPSLSALHNINQGEDVVFIGPHMNNPNGCFVKTDSGIDSVDDLQGKKLGVTPETSGVALTAQAMFQELEGFDIWEDTEETIATSPPSLWNLFFEQDEIDAMFNFTGFTIKALANSDTVKMIFDPLEVWQEATGFPPPTTAMVAQRAWVEENPNTAISFLDAWQESVSFFRDNVDEGITKFGTIAGLSDENEIAVVKDFLENKRLFPTTWNEDFISSYWQLFQNIQETGGLETVPSQDEYALTREDINALDG